MDTDKDVEFWVAVRAALCLSTCDVDFWRVVERRETDVIPSLLLPWWARYAALGALVAAIWCHGWLRGAQGVRDDWEAATAKQEAASLAHAMELAKRADEITLAYITQTRTVREKGATIIREVTRYVTPDADAACPTDGLVRVLNAAARNELPSATGSLPAAPAGTPANP